ncbi:hypothetical protein [Poseidonocella sp. HB161398]|uniref:hypothetical protein n=1 Tax=Poseidonocella sp. HB161398 TaxID=2320855 RepID=UPI0019817693|nr:hypothetical protein [Poseidonocella sp. HB161398]
MIDIIQRRTTLAEASRSFDLSPSGIEGRVEDGKRGIETSLHADPLGNGEQYAKLPEDLQEA